MISCYMLASLFIIHIERKHYIIDYAWQDDYMFLYFSLESDVPPGSLAFIFSLGSY